jgi:two-component system, cell cycle response regulator DivK
VKDSRRARPLVLVVDDSPDAREMYGEFLKLTGYGVAEAGNGFEAVERALELLPDVIVMDLALPGMDGWEATRRLKSDTRTNDIPIVALTGYAAEDLSGDRSVSACDTFISKPCLPDALVAEVRRMLARQPVTRSTPKTGFPS